MNSLHHYVPTVIISQEIHKEFWECFSSVLTGIYGTKGNKKSWSSPKVQMIDRDKPAKDWNPCLQNHDSEVRISVWKRDENKNIVSEVIPSSTMIRACILFISTVKDIKRTIVPSAVRTFLTIYNQSNSWPNTDSIVQILKHAHQQECIVFKTFSVGRFYNAVDLLRKEGMVANIVPKTFRVNINEKTELQFSDKQIRLFAWCIADAYTRNHDNINITSLARIIVKIFYYRMYPKTDTPFHSLVNALKSSFLQKIDPTIVNLAEECVSNVTNKHSKFWISFHKYCEYVDLVIECFHLHETQQTNTTTTKDNRSRKLMKLEQYAVSWPKSFTLLHILVQENDATNLEKYFEHVNDGTMCEYTMHFDDLRVTADMVVDTIQYIMEGFMEDVATYHLFSKMQCDYYTLNTKHGVFLVTGLDFIKTLQSYMTIKFLSDGSFLFNRKNPTPIYHHIEYLYKGDDNDLLISIQCISKLLNNESNKKRLIRGMAFPGEICFGAYKFLEPIIARIGGDVEVFNLLAQPYIFNHESNLLRRAKITENGQGFEILGIHAKVHCIQNAINALINIHCSHYFNQSKGRIILDSVGYKDLATVETEPLSGEETMLLYQLCISPKISDEASIELFCCIYINEPIYKPPAIQARVWESDKTFKQPHKKAKKDDNDHVERCIKFSGFSCLLRSLEKIASLSDFQIIYDNDTKKYTIPSFEDDFRALRDYSCGSDSLFRINMNTQYNDFNSSFSHTKKVSSKIGNMFCDNFPLLPSKYIMYAQKTNKYHGWMDIGPFDEVISFPLQQFIISG